MRLLRLTPRQSQRWKDLCGTRQTVERVFKSMKQSRRLERHCHMGLKRVNLHAVLSMIAFPATAQTQFRIGSSETGWTIQKGGVAVRPFYLGGRLAVKRG